MTEPVPNTSDALATPGALTRMLRGAPITDMLAAELVLRASAVVRDHCGWHITKQTDHEFVIDGPGTRTLFLPTLELTAVTSITENGTAVPVTDVDWSRAGMIQRRSCRCWTDRLSGITVVGTHGLETPPEGVAAVVLSLAAKAYANPTSQESAAAGVVNDRFGESQLTQAERNILVSWRVR